MCVCARTAGDILVCPHVSDSQTADWGIRLGVTVQFGCIVSHSVLTNMVVQTCVCTCMSAVLQCVVDVGKKMS